MPSTGEVVPETIPPQKKTKVPKVKPAPTIDADTRALVIQEEPTDDTWREFANAEAMRKAFNMLDAAIKEDCGQVATGVAFAEAVTKQSLLPHLARMQALLSQRGANHKLAQQLKLPTWTKYFAEVSKQFNLKLRTLQRHLKHFREPRLRPPSGQQTRVTLTAQQQRRLLEATLIWNDAVKAVEHGRDAAPFIRDYKKIALQTGEVDAMLGGEYAPDPVTTVGVELCEAVLNDKSVAAKVKELAIKYKKLATEWRQHSGRAA